MTIGAEQLRELEASHPDCLAVLVRSYQAMQEAVVLVPRANVSLHIEDGDLPDGQLITWAWLANGEVRTYVDLDPPPRVRWQHGDEFERHVNGELCIVVGGPFGPGGGMVP